MHKIKHQVDVLYIYVCVAEKTTIHKTHTYAWTLFPKELLSLQQAGRQHTSLQSLRMNHSHSDQELSPTTKHLRVESQESMNHTTSKTSCLVVTFSVNCLHQLGTALTLGFKQHHRVALAAWSEGISEFFLRKCACFYPLKFTNEPWKPSRVQRPHTEHAKSIHVTPSLTNGTRLIGMNGTCLSMRNPFVAANIARERWDRGASTNSCKWFGSNGCGLGMGFLGFSLI